MWPELEGPQTDRQNFPVISIDIITFELAISSAQYYFCANVPVLFLCVFENCSFVLFVHLHQFYVSCSLFICASSPLQNSFVFLRLYSILAMILHMTVSLVCLVLETFRA